MSFGIAARAKTQLEDAGFTLIKRESDGWWTMCDEQGRDVIAESPSLGDIIRKHATELGAW